MKLIGLLLISFIAYAIAGKKYKIDFTEIFADDVDNGWFAVFKPYYSSVLRKMAGKDSVMVKYTFKDGNNRGMTLATGTGPLCGNRDSEVGAIVELIEKILALNLKCPISEQMGTIRENATAAIFLNKNPGNRLISGEIKLGKFGRGNSEMASPVRLVISGKAANH